MGTFNLLFALRRHWRSRNHPIYKVQRKLYPLRLTARGRAFLKRAAAILSVVFFVSTVIIALVWLASPSGPSSLAPAMAVLGIILLGVLGLAFMGLFFWPMVASISTSRVIITERETQTWDILLTTPLDWREIVLAKGAAALQGLPPYVFVVCWSLSSAFVMLLVTASSSGVASPSDGLGGLLAGFLLMILLVVAGLQVYLWAAMIGLLASLFTASRQIAMAIAGIASFSVSLLTWFFVAVAARLLIAALSERFSMAYTTRLGLAGVTVMAITLLNEILLRRSFRLLLGHLGDGQLPSAPQAT